MQQAFVVVAVDCGEIHEPENGYATYDSDTTYNRIARLKCQSKFKYPDPAADGSVVREKEYKCDADGQWKYTVPDSDGQVTTEITNCTSKGNFPCLLGITPTNRLPCKSEN